MVLNPVLYRALRDRFAQVCVNNRGQTMLVDLQSGDAPGVETVRVTRFGEVYVIPCPFCKSQRPCLSVSHRYGEYDPITGFRNYGLARCFRKGCLVNPVRREKLADMVFGLINRNRRSSQARITSNQEAQEAPALDSSAASQAEDGEVPAVPLLDSEVEQDQSPAVASH